MKIKMLINLRIWMKVKTKDLPSSEMPKKTKEQFALDVHQLYGDLYNCDKVIYINNKTKVILDCQKHGEFSTRPNDILNGHACQKCGAEREEIVRKKKTKTQDKFIEEAKLIHGNFYDYSKTIYKNSKSKVIITCPDHGDFEITADKHVTQKSGCFKCGNLFKGQYCKKNTNEFIEEAKLIHGNKFDYSKVNYTNANTKVIIICSKHGEFEQTPSNHLNFDCMKCAIETTHNLQRKTTEQFIEDSQYLHGNKYDYRKVEYINAHSKITLICERHGEFDIIPHYHLSSLSGCPRCTNFVNENECILIIETLTGNKFNKCRPKFLKGLELDGYNEELKVAIEYNGEQHYKIIDFFHRNGIYDLQKQMEKDKRKNEICKENGIHLITVPYYIEDKVTFIQEQLDLIDV